MKSREMIWDFWRGWEATRSSETVRWEGSSREDGGDDMVGLLFEEGGMVVESGGREDGGVITSLE